MNENGPANERHVREMREEAFALETDAERSGDPKERRRLQQRVKQMEFDCEQESMMAAGDIYPAP
ncbi:DUF6381 family protein [Streptomyces sp. NBC_00669]|uniref:DUF6381 family protein n=1 Tax=unclassified Streptomyces TaxID=2593676 RepID=UPI002E24A9B7|nr:MULTISPECIES: DUF6381 family protein [unclassified Streptomyces]